jgi:hypothetical protein
MPKKPPPEAVFARAVAARAAGNSWLAVAKLVNRSPQTVRKWPRVYAERWSLALRAAGRANIDDAANESVHTLRQLLQCEDEKLRAESAWRLIYQRLEQCKLEQKAGGALEIVPRGDAYKFEQFMKETTHDERMQILASFFRGPLPRGLCLADAPGARAG